MQRKAVSIKAKRPNPLFEKWLTEWKNSESNETKHQIYDTALTSLQKFPLPLATGRDCIILKGFGEKLCTRLEKKLEFYQQNGEIHENNIETIECATKTSKNVEATTDEQMQMPKTKQNEHTTNNNTRQITKTETKNATYCPAYRSGGYGILCALYKNHIDNVNMNESPVIVKKDLILKAQRFCDKSYTKKEPNCFYTAWSSMRTLITKQLVSKAGNPAKFTLTDQGVDVGRKLYDEAINDPDNAAIKPENEANNNEQQATKLHKQSSSSSLPTSSSSQSTTTSRNSTELIDLIFTPGTFSIYLLVDTQETSGATKKEVYDEIIMELNNLCVHYEIRHLKVGDYTWICRHNETQQELVLPYIIERKRMDDFGSSIKDGRFHEQKFRLKQSGVQNLIYLVESYGNNSHVGLPLSSVYQAATNTLLQDEFMVKFTENIRRTAEYLATFSKLLNKIFAEKTMMSYAKADLVKTSLAEDLIPLMTFKDFNQNASKNKAFKVSDMFVKQLLQLNGISVDKALAIVDKYPTPRMLKFAYEACNGDKEKENLLSYVEFGSLRKKVGPVISSTIYQLYNYTHY